jgi:outer membrane murein-binding lipoprotein Lpp
MRAPGACLRGLHGAALRVLGGLLVAAATLLAGCASTYRMDSTVQSFSALSEVPPQAGYRYERLPSQVNDPMQPRLEAAADEALARVGLRRDDASPALSVQVWGRTQYAVSPWSQSRWGGWGGWGGVGLGSHSGVGLGVGIGIPLGGIDSPWYQREVGLVLREIATGRVVYETRAFHEGYWIDPARAWPALLGAALQGFPRPPPGLRRVDVTLPR